MSRKPLARCETLKSAGILVESSPGADDVGFDAILVDSRRVTPGSCFIAFRGVSSDGHAFIPKAIESGAGFLVVEHRDAIPPGTTTPWAVVTNGRAAWAHLAAAAAGDPQNDLTLLAVTGTNGKTSTAWMTGEILRASGVPCLTIGTLGLDFGDGPQPTGHTTPDPDVLYPALAEAIRRGIRAVAMEASSHAIVQEKMCPMRFTAAAFTSFTRDHLDFHGTMERYFADKGRLFAELMKPGGKRIYWRGLDRLPPEPGTTYGLGVEADFSVRVRTEGFSGATLEVNGATLQVPYFGKHALENFCAAYLLASAALPGPISPAVLPRMRHVPGRLQRVNLREDEPQVIVDYAHTPDAIEKTLEVVRPLCRGKLFVVFGCGGDRDRGKRPLMAAAAEKLADAVYITSDNPRTEDPAQIIADARSGLKAPAHSDVDRRAAIFRAVADARPEDTVVVAGKGHEPYQEIGKQKFPFDDRDVSREALAARRPS